MAYSQDTSVASMIAATLQGVPNKNIDPRLWNELTRIQGSLKGMAATLDALRAPLASQPPAVATYYQGQGYAVALQDKDKLDVIAGEAIDAENIVTFKYSSGVLQAFKFRQGDIIDGFTANAVAAGAVGTFILKGLIVYSRPLYLFRYYADQHYFYTRSNPFGRVCGLNTVLPGAGGMLGNGDIAAADAVPGRLAFCGYGANGYPKGGLVTNPLCSQYAGTIIGSLSPQKAKGDYSADTKDLIQDAIIYFNPAHIPT